MVSRCVVIVFVVLVAIGVGVFMASQDLPERSGAFWEEAVVAGRWSNRFGSATCAPARIVFPRSTDEVSKAVRDAVADGLRVAVTGTGGAYSQIACEGDKDVVLISMDSMTAVVEQPSDSRLVVQAGMTLGEIVARFAARGHSIHYGEDESRTLIGLAQSGEHVSSQRYHGFATMIAGFTIVAADGKAYVAHRSSNIDLFKTAGYSAGTMGIITEVTIDASPTKVIDRSESGVVPIQLFWNNYPLSAEAFEYFSFTWFPHTDLAVAVSMSQVESRVDADAIPYRIILMWRLFRRACHRAISRLISVLPFIAKFAHTATAWVFYGSSIEFAGLPWDQFPIDNLHPDWQSTLYFRCTHNYTHVRSAFYDFTGELERRGVTLTMPLRVRFLADDEMYLSPAYKRAAVGFHVMHVGDPTALKEVVRDVLVNRYGAVPSFGSDMSLITPQQLRERTPGFQQYDEQRAFMDPNGVFMSPSLRPYFAPQLQQK